MWNDHGRLIFHKVDLRISRDMKVSGMVFPVGKNGVYHVGEQAVDKWLESLGGRPFR